MRPRFLVLCCAFVMNVSLAGQSSWQNVAPTTRIVQEIDEAVLTKLRGNVHPLARPELDRGALEDSQHITHMHLVLQRSDQQETALLQLLDQQQDRSSPNFHVWLTPQQFGEKFGASDGDLRTITDWLTQKGFTDIKTSTGRITIEFAGTASQVQRAFRTPIHRYVVHGNEYFANTADPQIPEAMAPVVAGIAQLHNFPKRSYLHNLGVFTGTRPEGEAHPHLTTTKGCGPSQAQPCYAVGPWDFATIYKVPTPLTGGGGQNIAIVAQSNINVSDIQAFQILFGLPPVPPHIILSGPDPGIVRGDEDETVLDTEWAGAIAPFSTIDVVASETAATSAFSGVDISALYIVDNDLDPIMSESYGECEAGLGTAGNLFYKQLWEQAAAQGITVILSAGDNGAAGCDDLNASSTASHGLAVSGLASTPFNVAVGGTDFDENVNGTFSPSTYWNATNGSGATSTPYESAKGYIPEQPLNDSCADSATSSNVSVCVGATATSSTDPCPLCMVAGSGGQSTVYAKPAWQTGPGTQTDTVRNVPDVSLFSGVGGNSSFYVVCQADVGGSCMTSSSATSFSFIGAGGTSASAPIFAAIMALVNQKIGAPVAGTRQGLPNYVLYKMAASASAAGTWCPSNSSAVTNTSCIFYDIVTGNNSVPCAGKSTNCSSTTTGTNGVLVTPSGSSPPPAWMAATGYDMATGLGSLNVTNLLNNWANTFAATTTTITSTNPSPISVTHGTPVTLTVQVAPQSTTGTPTGDVSLRLFWSSGVDAFPMGLGPFPLPSGSGAVTFTTNMLPGGTSNSSLLARYSGDQTFAASQSASLNFTITPEKSKTLVSFVTFSGTPPAPVFNAGPISVPYGSAYILRVDVTRLNPDTSTCVTPSSVLLYSCPTGTVTMLANGSALNDFDGSNTPTLNSGGFLEDQPIQLAAAATPYSIVAKYGGDNSYNASDNSGSPLSVTITQAGTSAALTASPTTINSGSNVTFTATISTTSNGAAPTGTVKFLNGTAPLTGTPTCTGKAGSVNSSGTFVSASLTCTLTAAISSLPPATRDDRKPKLPLWPLGILAAAMVLLILARRLTPAKRRYAYAAVILLAAVGIGGEGCGGGSSSSSSSRTATFTASYSGDTNYGVSSSSLVAITVQ